VRTGKSEPPEPLAAIAALSCNAVVWCFEGSGKDETVSDRLDLSSANVMAYVISPDKGEVPPNESGTSSNVPSRVSSS
jgi:hypothetical protein